MDYFDTIFYKNLNFSKMANFKRVKLGGVQDENIRLFSYFTKLSGKNLISEIFGLKNPKFLKFG